MLEVEQKDPEDLVFPQDLSVAGVDGKFMRHGGMTKHEMFTGMFIAAAIQRGGIPPTPEAAQATVEAAVALAGGTVYVLKNYKTPPESGLLLVPGFRDPS